MRNEKWFNSNKYDSFAKIGIKNEKIIHFPIMLLHAH